MSVERKVRPDHFGRDRRLIALWKAGNKDAGKELLGHYHVFLLGLLMEAGIRTASERDGIYEELVASILEDLPRLRLKTFFSNYLEEKLARLLALRKRAGPSLPHADRAPRGKFAPLEGEDLPYAILDCQKALEKRERFVFRARTFDNAPYSLIARTLRLKIKHLAIVLHRARGSMSDALKSRGFTVDEKETRTVACGAHRANILLLCDRSLGGRPLRKTVDHLKACKACRDSFWDTVSFERAIARGVDRLPFESRSYLSRIFSEACGRSPEKSGRGVSANWIRGLEVGVAVVLVVLLAGSLMPGVSERVLNLLAGLFSG